MKSGEKLKMKENSVLDKLKIRGNAGKTLSAIALISMMLLAVGFPFMNQKTITVNAQTQTVSTVPSNMLQYTWLGPQNGYQNHFSAGPAPTTPDVLWQKLLPVSAGKYPAAFNGMLFITLGSNVTAIDPETGNTIYNVPVPSPVPGRHNSVLDVSQIDSTTMAVESTVSASVSANMSNTLLAAYMLVGLNIADGSILWQSATHYTPTTYNAYYISDTQMFYVNSGNSTGRGGTQNPGQIDAWSLSSPTQAPTYKWTYIGDGGHYGAGGFTYGDGRLFIGGAEPHQVCLNATTGQTLWTTLLTGAPYYAASYYNGVLYQGLLDNTFVAINGTTGAIMWTYNPHDYGFWSSGTAAGYGLVYELNVDGYLYALNATTGNVVWKYLGPGQCYPGYVEVADGMVYGCTGQAQFSPLVGMGSSEYACLNAYTGQVIWQVPKEFDSGPSDVTCIAYGNFYGMDQELKTGVTVDSNVAGVWPAAQQYVLICYGAAPQDWTMFGGNSMHSATGYGGPTNLNLNWVYHTNGPITSSAAVVQGLVYFGSWDQNIYCLNATSGAKIWNFTTGYFVRSSPAVVDGYVYTGADDGYVYCLNANTGALVWKTPAPGQIEYLEMGTYPQFDSSPIVVNGQVFVGSLDGKMYCLNAGTGAIEWTLQTTGSILSTPTYVAGDGIYFASVDGFVYKTNFDGNVIWNVSTPIGLEDSMEGSVCIGDGIALIGSGAAKNSPAGIGQMYAFNSSTGALVWVDSEVKQSGNMQPTWTALYVNSPLLGPVFYFNDFFDVDCVHANNGSLIWQAYLTRESFALPAYSDGKIYTGRMSNAVYVTNATDGAKLGYFDAGAEVASSIAIYNNDLYFGTYGWNFYCLSQSSSGTTYYGSQSVSPSPSVTPTPAAIPTATSAPTTAPTPSSTPPAPVTSTVTASPSPVHAPSQGQTNEMYIVVAASVIIIVVAVAAAVILRRRRTK